MKPLKHLNINIEIKYIWKLMSSLHSVVVNYFSVKYPFQGFETIFRGPICYELHFLEENPIPAKASSILSFSFKTILSVSSH